MKTIGMLAGLFIGLATVACGGSAEETGYVGVMNDTGGTAGSGDEESAGGAAGSATAGSGGVVSAAGGAVVTSAGGATTGAGGAGAMSSAGGTPGAAGSSAGAATGGRPNQPECAQTFSEACVGPGGCKGQRYCNAVGTGPGIIPNTWAACLCPEPPGTPGCAPDGNPYLTCEEIARACVKDPVSFEIACDDAGCADGVSCGPGYMQHCCHHQR